MVVLQDILQKAQHDQAKNKNNKMKSRNYKISEKVYLNGKNIRTKQNNKLKWKMFGPFEIINIKNMQAYKLALLPHWKIHNIFHVSLLEKTIPKKEKNAT